MPWLRDVPGVRAGETGPIKDQMQMFVNGRAAEAWVPGG